jgi:hypothetical protein
VVYAVISEGAEEVSSEHAGKDESDDDGENDSKTNRVNAGSEVGACVLNLVDNVECVLDGGDTDGGGPDGSNEAKGELAGRGGGGGLVEGLQHGTEGSSGNDECEIVKETFVDTIGGAGGQAEDGACAEERGKKGEEEVEAKFGGVSEEVVGEAGPPGPVSRNIVLSS